MSIAPLLLLLIVVAVVRSLARANRPRGTGRRGGRLLLLILGFTFFLGLIRDGQADDATSLLLGLLILAAMWAVPIGVVIVLIRRAKRRRESDTPVISIPTSGRPPATRRQARPEWADVLGGTGTAPGPSPWPPRQPPAPRSTVPERPQPAPPATAPPPAAPTPVPKAVASGERPRSMVSSLGRSTVSRTTSTASKPPLRRKTASAELVERANASLDRRRRSRS